MCEVGGDGGDMSLPVKIVIPPAKKENLSRGGCQNVPPSDKYRKKLNVFIRVTCKHGLRRYFPAYLVAIMVSFAN